MGGQADRRKMRARARRRRRPATGPCGRRSRTPAPCRAPPPRRAAAGRRSRQPASSAWPKVWPRLSSARSPLSRSSRATTPALARQQTAMACSRAGSAGEDVLPVRFQPGEEGGVADQPVFGDLGIAGAEFALRQRVEQRGVGDHHGRLMEGADQVLALARIDAGLAADRTSRLAPAAWSAPARSRARAARRPRRSRRDRRSRRRRGRRPDRRARCARR